MYPLDQGRWGPTVRISNLRDELSRLVDLDVVDGYRGPRRAALVRYALSGRLRGLDGIYVESSSFLPAELDIVFLGLARALGIPVLTYVRDAYQLFPEYHDATSVRRRLGFLAFRPALRALRAVSSRVATPTAGLAHAILGSSAARVLLPPGAPEPMVIPAREDARSILVVGDARLPSHGVDRLVDAVASARRAGSDIDLISVARPGQHPPPPHPEWLRLEVGEAPEIAALLPGVLATAIPRPRSAYNDLALPIKLYDYLAYGRPLLVTDCLEQARVVEEADAGVVVGDTVDEMAAGLRRLTAASPQERQRWSENAIAAARAASWSGRAERIVDLLRELRA
jgi:glycosyltransferase involved in cell wall biosynthesis